MPLTRSRATALAIGLACAGDAAAHRPGAALDAGTLWVALAATGLALSAWAYARGLAQLWGAAGRGRGIRGGEATAFAAGWALLALCIVSPVDTLGEALFSMHMVQHELMMLLAAPLLVAGRPLAAFAWALPPRRRRPVARALRPLSRLWRAATRPVVAWSLFAATLWGWHVPALFDLAIRDDGVHALQHLSFLLAALAFWRALFDLFAVRNAAAVAYVFATALHSCVLGALLALAPTVWYPAYGEAARLFGLSPLDDQRLGGLIMWMPAGTVYLAALLAWVAVLVRAPDARAAAHATAAGGDGA